MSKYKNSGKDSFLNSIPQASIDSEKDTLAGKCKFNFSYYDVQPAGQSFEDWTKEQLSDLLHKLKDYSRESLSYWVTQRVFVIYGAFPRNSKFTHPRHIPHQAQWARFRLESAVRLVGFILPEGYNETRHEGTKKLFDCNTFYVVFLDENHQFYLTEQK